MATKPLPDPELLRKVLDYDPETGVIVWRHRPREHFKSHSAFVRWNKLHSGQPAFACSGEDKYCSGMINGMHYYAHRIIWAYVYGDAKPGEIDHINGNRADNRIANLRIVTRLGNTQNRKVRTDNKTGVPGVYWEKSCSKWRAEIKANKRRISLGVFDAIEDAIAARKAAEKECGFHPNHGRSS